MIKLRIKNKSNITKTNSLVFGVSIHNPLFSVDRISKVISQINESDHLKNVRVIVSDSLNRHNYMALEGMTEAEAFKKARNAGDKWIKNNSFIFEKLNVPYTIARWDHFINNPKYWDYLKIFNTAFENCQIYKDAVLDDALQFYKRKGLSFEQLLPKEVKGSVNYILEENAAYTICFEQAKGTKAYPAKEASSFAILREGKVPNVPKGMMNYNYMRLVFNTKPSDNLTSDLCVNREREVEKIAA